MTFGVARRRTVTLPEDCTGFVGRTGELAHVGDLLSRARLVTVTGTGGVGKTRLALRAADRAGRQFADGVCLVELSALRDPELLPYAIAIRLGLPEQDGRPRLAAVLGYLRDRMLLLILDTCEHLIDACAVLVEAVLREAPGVTVLATSRQPLDVPGESVCLLAPLPVRADAPPPFTAAAAAGQGAGDAVELFAQRAAASLPGFRVTADNLTDVVWLCRRLDGIPLAIELAAVRLRALPLPELVARLETRFPLLAGARRGATDRHRTLRDTIGWSYELCSPAERDLWARLSVFADPFCLDAAAEVCADADLTGAAVVETIIRLVDKSVLLREPWADTRYRMLDTIREFGVEQLAASGREAEVRDRHAARYLAMARRFECAPLAGQLFSFRALYAEHFDVQAALWYMFGGPDGDRAAELTTGLLWYWQISGLLREGRFWLTKAVERLPDPSPRRADALGMRGYLGAYQGDADAGLADTEASLAMLARLGTERPDAGLELARLRARGQVFSCRALTSAGRLEEAAAAGRTAAALLDAAEAAGTADPRWCLGTEPGTRLILITHQAYIDLLTGDLDGCLERCAAGLRLARPEHGERWISSRLNHLTGLALCLRGEHDQASIAVRDGLAMKHELGDTVGIAYGLGVLAMVAAGQRGPRRAALALGAADPIWARLGAVFSGNPTMQELLDSSARTAAAALGDGPFGRLRRDGAQAPLDDVLAMAVDDADALTRPPTGADSPAAGLLTSRELEIAGLVGEGMSNRKIAEKLVISKRTVDAHISHIFSKLDISSRLQLISWLRDQMP